MKALWLITPGTAEYAAGGTTPVDGLALCPLASVRLRVGIAASAWERAGHQYTLKVPGMARVLGAPDDGSDHLCITGKFVSSLEPEPWLAACAEAKRRGSRLVVDVCDNPFFETTPAISRFYHEALAQCDAVVVNSEKMAELIAPYSAKRPFVIEDPTLGVPAPPAFSPGERLELLWFGHSRNLVFLARCVAAVAGYAQRQRCRLTIVSDELQGHAEAMTRYIQTQFAPALEARFIRWSLEANRKALRHCDLVLVPGDPSHPMKAGVSANRIAEALNAGRFPVASPLASYLPFSDSAWLGADLAEGVRWAMANRGEVLARVRSGQALVQEKFSAEKIGRRWCELFASLA